MDIALHIPGWLVAVVKYGLTLGLGFYAGGWYASRRAWG